jgi:Ca2+-binding EF-hand superfamily protein
MTDQGESNYFPAGYAKCDLKSKNGPLRFESKNDRAWTNPTPTPWGKDRILTNFTPAFGLTMSSESSASNVVGKFRSLYTSIIEVKDVFSTYDINRDGNISREELENGMVQSGQFSFDEARIAFDVADINGDGEIDIAEFVQLMFPTAAELVSNLRRNFKSMEDVERAFKSWDIDGDGQISFSELKSAVSKSGQRLSEEEMNAIFVIGDIDQNGEIDFEEFTRMMMPTASDVVTKFRSIHKTMQDVQAAFKRFDKNSDGSIDRKELTMALTTSGMNFTQQEIDAIFKAADANNDGDIDYEEFVGLMCPSASQIVAKFRNSYKSMSDVRAAFKRFDKNGDGALDKAELGAAMKSSGQSYSDIEVDAIFSLGDADGDGEITLEEFVALMSPSASEIVTRLGKSFRNIEDVKAAFKKIDTDNDGLLSKSEMMNAAGNKFDKEEVDAIFQLGDVNGDGQIDMGEFIGIMYPAATEIILQLSSGFKNIDDVKQAFKLLDNDGDGSISREEMAAQGHKFNRDQIESIFALGDVNDDGAIDLDEFIAVMCPSAEVVIARLTLKFNNINDVKKMFLAIDVDHDGLISRKEMGGCGKFNPQEVDAIFILGDANGDGEIDIEEFIGLMVPTAAEAISRLTNSVKNVADAQQLFRLLDVDGDGNISHEEMRSCGQKFNAKEIEAIFAIGDINNDGAIDMGEFVAVMCPAAATVVQRISKGFKTLDDVKMAFKKIDRDNDGNISKDEMRGANLNEQEVNAVFAMGDTNNDGEIDIDEFIQCMCPSASAVVFKISKMFNGREGATEAFKKIDADGDGNISKKEMSSTGLNPIEVDAIFKLGDANGDGEIDLEEFLAVMVPSAGFASSFSSSSSSSCQTSSMTKTSSTSFSQSSSSSMSSSSQFYSSKTSSSSTSVSVSFSSAVDVKNAFRKFDVNGDGHIDRMELKQLLSSSGKQVSDQEVDILFRQGDIDGDGLIDMPEFVKLMFPASATTLTKLQKSYKNLNDIKAAFRKYDSDGDGHIDRNELRQVMASFNEAEVDSIFALGDKDQSGGIDYQEFIFMMMPTAAGTLKKIAGSFSSIQQVKDGFKKIDVDGDGAISKQEMKNGMRLNDDELNIVFAIGDVDQDGQISLAEFVRLMSPSAASSMNRLRNTFRDIQEVIMAFKKFDTNRDGAISQQELLNGMRSTGLDFGQDEARSVFEMADVNTDGEINYTEFVSALFPAASDGLVKFRSKFNNIPCVKQAFRQFDADGDGAISIMELKNGMGGGFSSGEISSVFCLADVDGDGQVSFAEFASLIIPSASEKIGKLKKNFNSSKAIEDAFNKFDVNRDGKISVDELRNGLNNSGLRFSPAEVDTIFAIADIDGDGEISLDEFKELLGDSSGNSTSASGSASGMTFNSADEAKAAFRKFDTNKDGHLDRNEFKNVLCSSGSRPSEQEADAMFRKGDCDGDGKIDLQEFIKLMFPKSADALNKLQQSFSSLEQVKASFRQYDADGDGHITRQELKGVMSRFSEAEVDAVFALGDKDQSGGIDYQEFIALMLPAAPGIIQRLSMTFRSVSNVKECFKKFDTNGDGQICRMELEQGMKLSKGDLDVVFAIGDLDGDGEISLSEFVRIMCPGAANAINRFRNCFKDIHELINAFRQIDENGDGAISQKELTNGMRNMRMSFSNEEVYAIFAAADINRDGEIGYTEFISLMIPTAGDALSKFRKCFLNVKSAKDAFNRIDVDRDGTISFEELFKGMGNNFSQNEVKAVFAMGDSDQDGQIDFIEFSKLMIPAANDALAKFWKCFRDIQVVKQAFSQFDTDNDGRITRDEVMAGMRKSGRDFSSDEIDAIFILADRDGDGQIDFAEFAVIMIPSAPERISKLRKTFRTQADVEAAFKRFDTNHDGSISFQEMKNGLKNCGVLLTDQEIETIFAMADVDGDGEVSMSEFVHLLCPEAPSPAQGSGNSASSGNSNANEVVIKFRGLNRTIEDVRRAFKNYDANGDGAIDKSELQAGMSKGGQFTKQEATLVFDLADINGDGEIDIAEFVQMMFPNAAELISKMKGNFSNEQQLQATFRSWDTDNDGAISFAELKNAVQRSGQRMTEEEMNAIFAIGDADQNGEIDFDEFKAMMLPSASDVVSKFRSIHKTVKDVQMAFKKIDDDGNGSIDKDELTSALTTRGMNFTQQEIDAIFRAGDADGDGAIDYEEFVALMCPSASTIISKFRSAYKNIGDVKAAFKRFDKDGDGEISEEELSSAMKSGGEGYSDMEISAIFALGDADGDGSITLQEFVNLMSPSSSEVVAKLRQAFKNINDVKDAFKKIDTDNDGLLSKKEILNSRANKFDNEEVDAIFALGDVNGDGEIDMGEFIALMYPQAVELTIQLSRGFNTMDDVKAAFGQLDADGDGSITRDEMARSSHRFTRDQIEAVFALGDINDDGALDLDEFVGVMCPSALTVISRIRQKFNNINNVKKAFLAIDKDGDGSISVSEMSQFGKFNNQEVDAIFMLGDINQDGAIDLEEFVGLMNPSAAAAITKLTKSVKNIGEAQQVFRQLDKDGDGKLSHEEMIGCRKFNSQEVEAIFAIGDIDNDGEIDMDEFIAVMCPCAATVVSRLSQSYKTLEEIKNGFRKLDVDGDGEISRSEMASAGFNEQEIEAIFKLGDANGDGAIDMDEFIGVMCPSAAAVVFKVSQTFQGKDGAIAAFKKIDMDGDGNITKKEMSQAVLPNGQRLSETEVSAIFQLGDINKDGELDMEEFIGVMAPAAGFSIMSKVTQVSSFSSSSSSSMSFSSSSQSHSSMTVSSSSSSSMSFSGVSDVKDAFRKFDVNGDGFMDMGELKQMMNTGGKKASDSEVAALFKKGDLDGDGQIDLNEFVKMMFPISATAIGKLQQKYTTINDAKAAFRKCDADGDGHITRQELQSVMTGMTPMDVDAVFALGDADQNGGIDYQEFIAMLIPNCSSILRKISSSFKSIQQVKEGFKKIDADGDGAISRNEMKNGLRLSDAELDVVFALGDIDQDGEISMPEFVTVMCPSAASGLHRLRNSFRNIQEVTAAFKRFDTNSDGAISQQELASGMRASALNIDSEEVNSIFALADINQDGEVNYAEFVSALFPVAADGLAKFRHSLKNINSVRDAFRRFDADGDGSIDFQEFKRGSGSLNQKFSDGELTSVFAIGDCDQDGSISFPEFARLVLPSADDMISHLKKSLGSASDIAATFNKFDINKDGQISNQELRNGLKSIGMKFTDIEVETIFAVADLDGDGEISICEFEALLGTAPSFGRIEDVKAAFYRFDQDNDGHIDRNELKQMLVATGKKPSEQEVDSLFRKGDLDGDGKIDRQEFIRMMFPASAVALTKLQKAYKCIHDIKVAFRKHDSDGDGHISRMELKGVMNGFSDADVEAVFALGDKDQSGGIDYQEFIGLMMPSAVASVTKLAGQFRTVGDVKVAFKRFDLNGDGQISRQELKSGMRLGDADLDSVFAMGDLDGDGEINLGEFIHLMCPLAANALSRFRNSFSSIEDVVSSFKHIDSNGDGAICQQELSVGLNSYGKKFTTEEINSMFAMADVNADGEINYTEFVGMMFPAAAEGLAKFRREHQTLMNAKQAFDRYDADGDEEITHEELQSGMGGDYTANEINAIFAMGDIDQDGRISFLEFAKIMLPAATDCLHKFWKVFKDVRSVRDAFVRFDTNKDGQISRSEVVQGMRSSGMQFTEEEIDTLFILGDKDNNGEIDFSEFAQIMIPTATERITKLRNCFRNRAEVEAAFSRFDANHDGAISFQEMKAGLQSSGILFTEQEVETVFAVADRDGDGEVSLTEFVHILSTSSHESGVNGVVGKFWKYCVDVAFKQIDTNRDGAICLQELSSGLRASSIPFSDQDIQTIFALADHDRDGEVSLNELVKVLGK